MSHQDDRHSSTRSGAGAGAGTLRDVSVFSDAAGRSYNAIFLTALAIVRDHDTAADITQETFLRAWLKIDSLRDDGLLEPWLARIARNTAAQWLRTGQQRSRVLPLISMEEITVEPADNKYPTPRQAAGQSEENAQLTQAVMALPDDLRQAVLLHYAEGMSPSEIARLNGEAPSTVTRRLEKARGLLRQHLESGLAAGLAAATQALRPHTTDLQRTLGIVVAATAIPAVSRAQLLQVVSDTPPPPMIDAVTAAAQAATIEEAGIMKSIIAKVGAAKLIAGAAAIAAVGGGVYGVNRLAGSNPGQPEIAKVENSRNNPRRSISGYPEISRNVRNSGTAASQKAAAATRGGQEETTAGGKLSVSDRVTLLKNDLVSTHPTYLPDDGKTSAGILLDMVVVDGSGFPIEGATLHLYEFAYKQEFLSGTITLPKDTTGTLMANGYTLEPATTNASGIARILVPQYTGKHLTTSFGVRAAHPDYTATFAEMDLTSVTKLVMTGGHILEVVPVDAATSAVILSGVTPEFESAYKPDWEQRSDGTIVFRKISGEQLLYYLKCTDPAGRKLLSGYQKVRFPLDNDNAKPIALAPTLEVRGSLSPNVPRPVKGGKIRAQASAPSSCTKLGFQEVEVAEDGTFHLTGLPAGEVHISGLSESHNSTRPEDDPSTDSNALAQRFHLSANSQEYILPMATRGTLRVKVVDAQQRPVEGAKLICMSQIDFNGCTGRWEEDRFAKSDHNGVAEITGIPALQFHRLYVAGEWQLLGKPVGTTKLVNRLEEFQLTSGEMREITLTVEPFTQSDNQGW